MSDFFKSRFKFSISIALVVIEVVSLCKMPSALAISTCLSLLRFDRQAHDHGSPRDPLLFVAPFAGANSLRPLDLHLRPLTRILTQRRTEVAQTPFVSQERPRWMGKIGDGRISVKRGSIEWLGRDVFTMAASGGRNTETSGDGDNVVRYRNSLGMRSYLEVQFVVGDHGQHEKFGLRASCTCSYYGLDTAVASIIVAVQTFP